MATLIFENADADHDGLLSIDEAANAAAKFVHDTDASGRAKLDLDALLEIPRPFVGGWVRRPAGSPPAGVQEDRSLQPGRQS